MITYWFEYWGRGAVIAGYILVGTGGGSNGSLHTGGYWGWGTVMAGYILVGTGGGGGE